VGEVTDQVTTATIAASPKNTAPTTFRSIRGFALPSVIHMAWHHFCVACPALYTDGVEKSQIALVRGRQLCTQLSIFEGSLAELLCFSCCQLQK